MGRGDGALTLPAWLRVSWVIPATFLVVFLLLPLGNVIANSASTHAFVTLRASTTWSVLALSLGQAALSTALSLAIGLPIALTLATTSFRGRALVQALATVPFVLPTVVVALAFKALFGGEGLWLVVLAHAYINLAVIVRIVGAQAAQLDPRIPIVARTLGATKLRSFWSVSFPALRPAIISAAAVVFIFCFTSLGIVMLIGDGSTRTLESLILRQTSVLLDFSGAAALAIVQVIVVAIVLTIGFVFSRSDIAQRDQTRVNKPGPDIWQRFVIAGTVVITVAPVAALLIASRSSWSLLNSIDAGTNRIGSPLAALGTSLLFAVICGVIAALVGGLAGIAVLAHSWGRVMALVAIVPLGISSATLGLGMLMTFSRPPLDLRPTGLLIPLAHSLIAIPVVVAVVAPTLQSADARIASVAATLGAGPTRAFLTAYGSTLRIVIIAAAGLACAISLGEFGAASFLARAPQPTVPIQIARLLARPGEASYGVAAALAVVLVALTLALVLSVDRLAAKKVTT